MSLPRCCNTRKTVGPRGLQSSTFVQPVVPWLDSNQRLTHIVNRLYQLGYTGLGSYGEDGDRTRYLDSGHIYQLHPELKCSDLATSPRPL